MMMVDPPVYNDGCSIFFDVEKKTDVSFAEDVFL